MQDFNEATRVQIPGLVHLTRIGYTYFGKISEEDAGTVYDPDTNILLEVFRKQFEKLNPGQEGLYSRSCNSKGKFEVTPSKIQIF